MRVYDTRSSNQRTRSHADDRDVRAPRVRLQVSTLPPWAAVEGPIDDTLDLHGMSASGALLAVEAFVRRVRKRQPGALVHVITGKGKGSPGRPVLKTRVRTMLRSGTLPIEAWAPDLDSGGFLLRLKSR